jgi:3D (Asp-Asp-Asp) domain-containing protein
VRGKLAHCRCSTGLQTRQEPPAIPAIPALGLSDSLPIPSFEMHCRAPLLFLSMILAAGCGGWGGGTKWAQAPLDDEKPADGMPGGGELEGSPVSGGGGGGARPQSRTIGTGPRTSDRNGVDRTGGGGHVLGTFRNTYYDFPAEGDHTGAAVSLMNASCQPIAKVPRGFYEAVCVQGSGSLKAGGTVSFSKRDCACAEVCPRTGQRICFDALDKASFPWGRGAAGTAITPLRTIAADTAVLPMGTIVYIPELDGAPRGEGGDTLDGCFVVEDRGMKVKGEHVDIFTGQPAQTAMLNERVPSNQGVTVVVDAPRCARIAPR